jgi:GxxExxY protein
MALLLQTESYAVLGACFEVYKDKGCGFLEAVYQECLALEFDLQKVPFEPQPELHLT